MTQALEQGRLGSCAHAGYHQYYRLHALLASEIYISKKQSIQSIISRNLKKKRHSGTLVSYFNIIFSCLLMLL